MDLSQTETRVGEPGPSARGGWRLDVAVIAALVGLQLLYFTGVAGSDDAFYTSFAWRAAHDLPLPTDAPNFFGRFIHWKLIQVAITALPGRAWAVGLPSLVAAGTLLVIVRALGLRLYGRGAAMAAVVVFGLVPVNVVLASVALPDMVGAAIAWGGLLVCCGALLEERMRAAGMRCLAGGFLIALAYSAKETVAILLPAVCLFTLLCSTRRVWAWRRAGLMCVGAALWVAAEALLMWQWTGDPLCHPHGFKEGERNYIGAQVVPTLAGYVHYWTDYLRWLLQPSSELAPMGPLLLAAVGFALVKRSRASALLLCGVVPGLIYLSFGSSDLSSYRPLIHQPRYLVPLLPAMALLAGSMLAQVWSGSAVWARRGLLAPAACAVVALAVVAPDRMAGKWYFAATFDAGYEVLARHVAGRRTDAGRVYAAPLTHNRLSTMHFWLDMRPVHRMSEIPRTAEEWVRQYGGTLVAVSYLDHRPGDSAKHAGWTLGGAPLTSLGTFQRVGRSEPPAHRLGLVWARLTGRPAETDGRLAVELYRVPTAEEWAAKAAAGGDRSDARPTPAAVPF